MQIFFRVALAALFLLGPLALIGCDSSDDDDDNLDGPATITGLILDSQEGEPLEGATVRFSRGNASRSATTDSTGTFTIEGIATGTFTMRVQADGYIDVVIENIEIIDGVNELPPAVAPVAPPEGAYRIILTWGEVPRDLDSHLTGPDGEGGRFHVAYFSQEPVSFANLDLDDVTSFGPETVTITPEVDGMYRYSVHNYSVQSTSGSEGIAGAIDNSVRARVQVYDSDSLVREFLAPAATPGNTWRVFEMNVANGNVTITNVNQYVQASNSDDMDVFRTGGKAPVSADQF